MAVLMRRKQVPHVPGWSRRRVVATVAAIETHHEFRVLLDEGLLQECLYIKSRCHVFRKQDAYIGRTNDVAFGRGGVMWQEEFPDATEILRTRGVEDTLARCKDAMLSL